VAYADFAINGSGAVTVPVYFNESPDRMTYILKHCGAKVVVAVGAPSCRSCSPPAPASRAGANIVADGGAHVPSECLRYETLIAARARRTSPLSACALRKFCPASSLLSSTPPALPASPRASCSRTPTFVPTSPTSATTQLDPPKTSRSLSFLSPTSTAVPWITSISSRCSSGLRRVHRCRRPGSSRSPPTITAAVPRFFEKIYARLVEQGSKNTGVKRMLFDWAMNVAQRATPWRATGALRASR